MTDVDELGKRRELAKRELERLRTWPPRVLGMSEAERDAQAARLVQEVAALEAEIQLASSAQCEAALVRTFGSTPGGVADEDAAAEADRLEAEMAKTIAGAEATIKGYCAKVNDVQRRYVEAAGRAGQKVRLDMLVNPTAQRFARIAEQAARGQA